METFRICTGVANDTWHLNLIVDVFAAILQSIKNYHTAFGVPHHLAQAQE
jgi:hypothetical protein